MIIIKFSLNKIKISNNFILLINAKSDLLSLRSWLVFILKRVELIVIAFNYSDKNLNLKYIKLLLKKNQKHTEKNL